MSICTKENVELCLSEIIFITSTFISLNFIILSNLETRFTLSTTGSINEYAGCVKHG